MLTVFHGSDTIAVRSTALAHVAAREAAGIMIYRIEADTYQPGQVADALGATSLFGEPTLYVFDTPSAAVEFQEAILKEIEELAETKTEFIVIDGKLIASVKKQYSKYAVQCDEITAGAAKKGHPFALTDALAQRDKKALWLLLQSARAQGSSDEELIGRLWWQLKTMRTVMCTNSAAEAGLNEFPYQKAKRALQNFVSGEVEALASSLLMLYNDGHNGTRDLTLALEAWVLQV